VLAVILTFAAAKQEIIYSGGLLLAYALGHWVLVLGAGISAGFAQKVLASKGIANFSSYSKKVAGVIIVGVGIYLVTYLF
jgi:cytochrome c-type biogenesis protein